MTLDFRNAFQTSSYYMAKSHQHDGSWSEDMSGLVWDTVVSKTFVANGVRK